MRATETTTSLAANVEQRFEALLDDLVGAHEAWLDAVRAHRAGISLADAAAIEAAIAQTWSCQHRVAELDQTRVDVLAAMGVSARLSEVAGGLPEPLRTRAVTATDALRVLMTSIRHEASVVQTASTSLMAHMRGIVGQVAAALNHAGTYGRGGRVDAGPVVVSSLDVRQ